MKLSFHPLTAERWSDFETLFGASGACGGCWCMVWRWTRKDFEANKGAGNKSAMKRLVVKGSEPGVLAYDGDVPIGWCAVAPRTEYVALERSRVLKPIDAAPVWSVSCLFVHKNYRRRGVSVALLKAVARFVGERGGELVEGYPVEPRKSDMPPVFAWTGLLSAFLQAGFKEVHRGSPTRPIMRLDVAKKRPTKRRSPS